MKSRAARRRASVAFVGRYKHSGGAQPNAEVKIQGKFGEQSFAPARRVNLPALETAHEHLPRVWARARVDALLYEMNLNGEREDYIAEIIRLSQKYKFVTPYTAFLAAPRSLLRSNHTFKESKIARDWLGDTFVDHFAATREWEHRQWQDAVTDWELKRYFEIV